MTDYTPVEDRKGPPGLRLHARTMKVQSARTHFGQMVLDFQNEREITDVEMVGILLETMQSIHKYALRLERHGTTEKKADEA